jgi:NAD-dependent deacetylase
LTREENLERARGLLKGAEVVLFFTGAGISAESGIPTFRGDGGYWRGFSAEDLATPEGFVRAPKRVWEWYEERRRRVAEAEPNPAHIAIAEYEREHPEKEVWVITQNVDGLHQRAGSKRVVEFHGSLWRMRGVESGRVVEDHRVPLPKLPPTTEDGELLRPDVVWFGEPIPEEVLRQSFELAGRCHCVVVVGTSAVVYPAAEIPFLALRRGAPVIEVNPERTPLTPFVTVYLEGKAGEVLPKLLSD